MTNKETTNIIDAENNNIVEETITNDIKIELIESKYNYVTKQLYIDKFDDKIKDDKETGTTNT